MTFSSIFVCFVRIVIFGVGHIPHIPRIYFFIFLGADQGPEEEALRAIQIFKNNITNLLNFAI